MTRANVYFANGNYERRSSKLADENTNIRPDTTDLFCRQLELLQLFPQLTFQSLGDRVLEHISSS